MVIYNERGVIGTLEKIKESMGCIPDEVTIKITKKETDQDQIYKEGIKIDNTTYLLMLKRIYAYYQNQ